MTRGRPLKFSSPEEMQAVIDDYFNSRTETQRPTVTGLALALDMSREGLVNYAKRDDYFDTITKAKGRVEEFLENRLYDANAVGSIFNLKVNYKWRDTQNLEISGVDGKDISTVVTVNDASNLYAQMIKDSKSE